MHELKKVTAIGGETVLTSVNQGFFSFSSAEKAGRDERDAERLIDFCVLWAESDTTSCSGRNTGGRLYYSTCSSDRALKHQSNTFVWPEWGSTRLQPAWVTDTCFILYFRPERKNKRARFCVFSNCILQNNTNESNPFAQINIQN